jgi:hypothetical protein
MLKLTRATIMRKASSSSAPPDTDSATSDQSRRFIAAARELGCEERLDRFDEAVRVIGKARRPPERGPAGKDRQRDETPR